MRKKNLNKSQNKGKKKEKEIRRRKKKRGRRNIYWLNFGVVGKVWLVAEGV